MKFYTNVEQAGNRLLVRGYEGGSPFSYRVPYNPTLYVASKNYSDWKTLEGDCVEPLKLGSINDAKEFVKNYREVDDFDICLLYTSPSPRDTLLSRMPSSA